MSEARIRALYESRLKTAMDALDVPVAYENVAYKGNGRPYVRITILMANTVSDTLDGIHRGYIGVCQIDSVFPAGAGTGDSQTLTQTLSDLFASAAILTDSSGFKVQQTTPLRVRPGLSRPSEYRKPHDFEFRADTM